MEPLAGFTQRNARLCQWDAADKLNVTVQAGKIGTPIRPVLSYLCVGFLGVLFRQRGTAEKIPVEPDQGNACAGKVTAY